MRFANTLKQTFAVTLLWLFASSLQAASLSVNPVLITLDSSDAIAAMTVSNQGEDDVVMQASIYAWSIRDNEEHYEPTNALIVSPPVFQLAAGKSQIVRIGLSDTEPKAVEQSFRVFLEQAPATPGDAAATTIADKGPQAVQMMLRLGFPVFVKAVEPSTNQLVWRAKRLANGRLQVEAENQGNAHNKISHLALINKKQTLASSEQLSYILPGSSRHWVLDVPPAIAAPYRIKAEAKDGVLETTVSNSMP